MNLKFKCILILNASLLKIYIDINNFTINTMISLTKLKPKDDVVDDDDFDYFDNEI